VHRWTDPYQLPRQLVRNWDIDTFASKMRDFGLKKDVMKVLMLNTYDEWGGAAKAAFRLNRGLQVVGVDSHLLVQGKTSDAKDVIAQKTRLRKSPMVSGRSLVQYLCDCIRTSRFTTSHSHDAG